MPQEACAPWVSVFGLVLQQDGEQGWLSCARKTVACGFSVMLLKSSLQTEVKTAGTSSLCASRRHWGRQVLSLTYHLLSPRLQAQHALR